jgi:two-component system phosphate regulon sensor histidine kinase PhoR
MRHRLTKARSESELTQRRIRFQGRAEGYQDLIDAIYYPLLLVRNARVAFANQAAQKLLGEHIVGQDIRIAIRHPAAAERLANAGAEHNGEPALLIGVGSSDQRWEMRVRSLEDGLKLVQLSDQSSRYAAEKMRTDFVANASHELRTPLAAIKGFIETLEDPAAGEDAPTRSRFLKIMFDEADRMQKLVEDLMSLSRIEAQKYHIPDQQVDLRALIVEVQEFFIRSRNHRDADFVLEIADCLPKVMGDRAQLSQLLHNLVSNAFKYGNKNRPVQISALPNRQQNMIILSVSDEGDGIDASHIPRLTERFYRVDKGRSRSIGGTGLGLAIVKHITERHGGRLEIRSEVGVGTTVQVSLPTREALPL